MRNRIAIGGATVAVARVAAPFVPGGHLEVACAAGRLRPSELERE